MVIINENVVKMIAEIDLKENGIYIVKDGQVQQINPPDSGHGEQSFTYKNGRVIRMDERKVRLL